jgi:hypothetical protein
MGGGIRIVWRVIGGSVQGTSHISDAIPCQDACDIWNFKSDGSSVVVAAVADGAGSAKNGGDGARLAVEKASKIAVDTWYLPDRDVERFFFDLYSQTLDHLRRYAEAHGLELKECACTLLIAILIDGKGYFAQVGDGAWVVEVRNRFECATWPQQGEFANETIFLTSEKALETIQIVEEDRGITFFSGFTDGIQRLALHYASRSAHPPFFNYLKSGLSSNQEDELLTAALKTYLASDRINLRTDDDKTLVIGLWRDGEQ